MTTINSNGGTIFLREESGNIEYKINEGSYISITSWPVTIVNTNPGSSNVTTVQLTENMTLSDTTGGTVSSGTDVYFICGSEYITFDGQSFIITIDNVTDYPGLIQNGTSLSNGETNINIQNIGLTTSNSSTLVTEGGWVAQTLFGKGISSGAINVNKCYSTGDISNESGGIMGKESLSNMNGGSITISECYSTGNISESGGGLLGYQSFKNISNGTITIRECYSTGSIGTNAGGICGNSTSFNATGGSLETTNCYSIGQISADGGGIYGSNTRLSASGGTVVALNCYTVGSITSVDTGIYGLNNFGGTDPNCISQENNNWVDANAIITIGSGSIAWLDLTNSDGTPWVLNSYDEQLYNPNSKTDGSISFTTNPGLLVDSVIPPITYTYQIVTVNDSYSIPSGVTINSLTGEITYSNLDFGNYNTKIIAGQTITPNNLNSYEYYEINNFNFIKTDDASGSTSTIVALPTSIVGDEVSTSNITVQLKDSLGNNIIVGGDIVTLSTNLGNIGVVTDNNNGTYSATYTSIIATGTATIIGTVNSENIVDTALITLTGGPPSEIKSTIDASPLTIQANGLSASNITVQLKDQDGRNITNGGDTVILNTTIGNLRNIIDNNNGTYSSVLTSTVSGDALITGNLNGSAMTNNVTVSIEVGEASGATSTITAIPNKIEADGISTSNITVQLKDEFGNNLTEGGDNVTLSTDLGSLSSVTDNNNGTYSAIYTSTTVTGIATISGIVNTNTIQNEETIILGPGPASKFSIIKANPNVLNGNGSSTSNILVQLRDINRNNITTGGDTVTLSTDLGSLSSPVIDIGDGTYSSTYTSANSTGIATINGILNGTALNNDVKILLTNNNNIKSDGGNIFIREDSGFIQYSFDQSNWISITSWPATFENENPGSGNITNIQITEDININSSTGGSSTSGTDVYFRLSSEYITFKGENRNITINGITDYPGLIQNGLSTLNGTSNLIIQDIVIEVNSSTLLSGNGWIGQSYFGNLLNFGTIEIKDNVSNGDIINSNCGGILGEYALNEMSQGTFNITNCNNNGKITGNSSGGIFGSNSAYNISFGNFTVNECYNNGLIESNGSNQKVGGIFGESSFNQCQGGTINITECFNNQNIDIKNSGGIFGSNMGNLMSGTINILNCFNTGDINNSFSGGILGPTCLLELDGGTLNINNSYNTGIINGNSSGGLIGDSFCRLAKNNGIIKINDCYNTGNIRGVYCGGLIGRNCCVLMNSGSFEINNSYNTGTIQSTSTFSGGIIGRDLTDQSIGGNINVNNCYSLGQINGNSSGGIIGSDVNASSGAASVNTNNSYSIGRIVGQNAGGIYGANNNGGNTNNCISSNNNTWNDTQATSTLLTGSDAWVDISEETNIPWLLKSYNAQIYNPDNAFSNQSYTSPDGLFVNTTVPLITYFYKIITINNSYTIPTGISINSTSGALTFNNPLYNTYEVNVLVGQKKTVNNLINYEYYQINTFTFFFTSIRVNGGNIVLSQNDITDNIEFTYNGGEKIPMTSWPVAIENSNPSSGNLLNIEVSENLIFNDINVGINGYFIIESEYITFNGENYNIEIKNQTNWKGLIENGTGDGIVSTKDGFTNITVNNLSITINNSSLLIRNGWLLQEYYANHINNGEIIINNCRGQGANLKGVLIGSHLGDSITSTALIKVENSYTSTNIDNLNDIGNLIGNDTGNEISGGTINILNCYSTGNISAGGILGDRTGLGSTGGEINIENCYSNGSINNGGGILGNDTYKNSSGGVLNIKKSYSTGDKLTDNSGGIFGIQTKLEATGGVINVENCFSTGDNGSGIFGDKLCLKAENGTININNCFTTGSISNNGGGLCGFETLRDSKKNESININDCYSVGVIGENSGGLIGSNCGKNSDTISIIINNSYSTGNIGINAGGIIGSNCGKDSFNSNIQVNNNYSVGVIGDSGGGIYGSNTRSGTSSGTVVALNCYTVGNTTTFNTGIYGLNNFGGSDPNCISTDNASQPDNTWVDANAILTIGSGSTAWLDLTNSDGTPWVLNSYDEQLYNPNSDSTDLNTFNTTLGLFSSQETPEINYIYQIVKVNNSFTIPSTITINENNGVINFNNIESIENNYIVQVLVGDEFTSNGLVLYKHYEINNFTLNFDSTVINSNGGNIYIKEESGIIEYSFNNINFIEIGNWPVKIVNTNPNSTNITSVFIETNLTIDISKGGNEGYFDIGSEYITINGENKDIIINNISNWRGLFKNGEGNGDTIIETGYSNIIIKDINILSINSTLSIDDSSINGGGWLTQPHYGNSVNSGYLKISNSTSNGNIGYLEGGLCGSYFCKSSTNVNVEIKDSSTTGQISTLTNLGGGGIMGSSAFKESNVNLEFTNCTSSGIIYKNGGGLFGEECFKEVINGLIIIENCTTNGDILGDNAGGLFGYKLMNNIKNIKLTINNCTINEQIRGNDAGGLIGSLMGELMENGEINITNCDQKNEITGNNAGGLIGSDSFKNMKTGTIQISNCNNSGNLVNISTGGLIGKNAFNQMENGNINITNCNNSGNLEGDNTGGLISENAFNNMTSGKINIINCTNSGNLTGENNGGLIGYNSNYQMVNGELNITNCTNSGNLVGNNNGGLIGKNGFQEITQGVINIKNSINNGSLIGESSGGLFGSNSFELVTYVEVNVEGCINNGEIFASVLLGGGLFSDNCFQEMENGIINIKESNNNGNINNSGGGIGGNQFGYKIKDGTFNIDSCYNNGLLNGNNCGGLFGSNLFYEMEQGTIIINKCFNTKNIEGLNAGGLIGNESFKEILNGTINISYCNSAGIINGDNSGGLIGQGVFNNITNCNFEMNNCFNIGTINGEKSGGLLGTNAINNISNGVFNINNCYCTGIINGNQSGGLIGDELCNNISNINFTLINSYSNGKINGENAGGLIGSNISFNSLGGLIEIKNSYSIGEVIGDNAGGIVGNNINSLSTINAENCYTIGEIKGLNGGGIFGNNNTSGQIINCISTEDLIQPNNEWLDKNASDTLLIGSNVWIDISIQNVPWLLNTFDEEIYSPNTVIDRTGYISPSGNFIDTNIPQVNYSYDIITVNDSYNIPNGITINSNNGKITFNNLVEDETYVVKVITGQLIDTLNNKFKLRELALGSISYESYEYYQINIFTLINKKGDRPRMFIDSTQRNLNITAFNNLKVIFKSTKSTNNFTKSDIEISNGKIINFSGSGKLYEAEVEVINLGCVTLFVPENSYTDTFGSFNLPSNVFSINFVGNNQYFDKNIIPKIFYNSIINRNSEAFINLVKHNTELAKEVLRFYNYSLKNSFIYKRQNKNSCDVKVPWELPFVDELIMECFQRANYYEYIIEVGIKSNYGYMVKLLEEYSLRLSYARNLLFQGKDIKKYYKLGPNIKTNNDFLLYLKKFT